MRRIIFAMLAWVWATASFAGVPCSLPFNLQNGTTADATQVMANYNALVTCLTNAAHAGANSDLTSLLGLTTPLAPSEGGSNIFIGGTSTGSANAQVVATTTPTNFGLTTGYTVVFVAGFTNSGAMTLNTSSSGVENVYKQSLAGPIALTGGEVVTGQIVSATWDGTEYQINPVPVIGAGWGLANNATGIQVSTANPPLGFDACSNLSITATVTSSELVLTFNGNNGSTPSATNPILCSFRDSTVANGDPVWATATAALSINTNAAGATLGSTNNNPFHFWIVLFNNGGTLVPAIINCSTPTLIYPLVEDNVASTTGISSGATSAGVFYSPNGVTVSSKAFRIVGYLSYESGLSTAGTYASAPTRVQLFGPGIKKPGDVVQTVYVSGTTPTAVSSTANTATALAGTITRTSKANLVKVVASGNISSASANAGAAGPITQIYRDTGTTALGNVSTCIVSINTTSAGACVTANRVLDSPPSSATGQYGVYIKLNTGTVTWTFLGTDASIGTNTGVLTLEEIMG